MKHKTNEYITHKQQTHTYTANSPIVFLSLPRSLPFPLAISSSMKQRNLAPVDREEDGKGKGKGEFLNTAESFLACHSLIVF